MTTLVRWNPTRDFLRVQNEMDRLMDSFFNVPNRSEWGLAVNVTENEEAFVVSAAMPGVAPDDIDVTLEDNVLHIKAETKQEEQKEGETYHVRECRYGVFSRSLRLPTAVNADAIEANYENGILKVTLPKAEEVKPKRIEIKR